MQTIFALYLLYFIITTYQEYFEELHDAFCTS